jgi:hypothetical protein
MPAIRYKWGPNWSGNVADGNLRTRWGGGWFVPSLVRAKVGDVGGGYWTDTGYRGVPNPPSAPWVHSWYDGGSLGAQGHLQVAWNYASGGAPVAHYEVALNNEANTQTLGVENSTDNISPAWGVNQNSYYQVYVRSVGATGLASGYQRRNVYIGRPAYAIMGTIHHADYWAAGGSIGYEGYLNNLAGPAVPGDVVVYSIHWQLWDNYGSNVLCVYPPQFVNGGDRQIQIIYNEYGVLWDDVNWPSPLDAFDYPAPYWGNGGRTGFICRGGGWVPGRRADGYVTVDGTRYYDTWGQVGTEPAIPSRDYW